MTKPKFEKTSWDLSQLAPAFSTPQYESHIQEIRDSVSTFTTTYTLSFLETISQEDFTKMMREKEQISFSISKISLQAYLQNSQDTKCEKRKKQLRFVEEFSTDISNKLRYIHLWYIQLPQEKAFTFAQTMGEDSYYFERKYLLGKHSLSEAEEKILSLKDMTGSQFLQSLYDSICSQFRFDFDGKTQTLTQMRQYMSDDNREKRRDASKLIKETFEKHLHILGDMYQSVSKDYIIESVTLRKFETPLQVRTESEDISQKAVLSLFEAAKSQNKLFHRFFKLKAKLLKLEKLELYDTYAPIRLTKKETIPYDVALERICAVAKTIHPKFEEAIIELVEQNHIDSVFSEHKRGGAFNYGVGNGIKPFVFMQYLDEEDDQFTLAHELGHAIHSMFSLDKSSYGNHASIGVSESASTFMEEMLSEYLFPTLSEEKQIELLVTQIQSAYQTIQRQIYISLFELEAHKIIEKGTTNSELTALWTQLQKDQFGDAVHISDDLISWTYIPHIYHTPYYCYNYGVGLILAMLLVEKRREDPIRFAKDIERYLSVAGTKGIVDTAKVVGIDLESVETWKKGYSLVLEKIVTLESLLQKKGLI